VNVNEKIYVFLDFCHFLCSSKYTLFLIGNWHVCGIHHWLNPDLFSVYFGTQKCDFDFEYRIIGADVH
jgi:hypothetical protein